MNRRIVVLAASAALASTMPLAGAVAKDGKNAAFIGGAAAGVVGGVLLNQAISGNSQTAEPVYQQPAPVYQQPAPVYVQPAPRYVQPAPVVYEDPQFNRLQRLRGDCDAGSRQACIRFGMILGQNREREAQWRRSRPDFYDWETN